MSTLLNQLLLVLNKVMCAVQDLRRTCKRLDEAWLPEIKILLDGGIPAENLIIRDWNISISPEYVMM